MQSDDTAVLNTLVRVQRFLDANGDALGGINQSGSRQILDDVVTTLEDHAVNQISSKRTGAAQSAKQRVLRNALKVNHMRPIATVAAAQLRQVPEFTALKMPPVNSTSRALIAYAGAMSEAASPYETTFIAAGLPPEFITRLCDAANALNDAMANRGATQSAQSGATAGLRAETVRGRQTVKVLDSIIVPQIADNLALLAEWKAAKRIGGRGRPAASTTIEDAAADAADAAADAVAKEPIVESPAAPSAVPPSAVPLSAIPPHAAAPTAVPQFAVPPSAAAPIAAPPSAVPLFAAPPSVAPLSAVPPTAAPPFAVRLSAARV